MTASFPSGKEISHQGIVLVDDKIWHIGGRAVNADGPVSSQVIIYDITNNSWKDGPQLKDPATGQAVPLGGGGAVLLGRTIHVFGGFSPTICIDQNKYHLTLDIDKWLADPLHTSWENKSAPLPTPRNHLSVTVLGGKIYALGGQFSHDCSGADQKYCHVYDAVTNTWTRLTDLPSPRSHTESSTYPVDGKIFMLGGQGTSGAAQNTAFIFTTDANNNLGSWSNATQYKLPNSFYGIASKVIGNSIIMSHGALLTITDERRETYTMPITRNIPYKLGFSTNCFSKTLNTNEKTIIKNFLYTIEGTKQYSLSSNAAWLKITKNITGTATQSAVAIEATIDATGLSAGNYSAIITANGTGTGQTFTSASFCVNLQVSSGTAGYTLVVNTNGNGTAAKNPNQTAYTSGTSVTLTTSAASGYSFTGWSGSASGSSNPLTVTMNGNKTITANFTASTGQQVTSFTLINADKDEDIKTITSGETINLATLPTTNLNIRANTNSSVGSVKFALSGAQTKANTENTAPYSLFGDVSGNYTSWTPALGDYTLKGTPYSASNAGGTTGTSLTVNFTVINQTQSSSDLITGISSATGNSYTLNNLAVDELIYTDRTYKFTSVPAFLNNAPYIKTPNDDKANKSTAALTFNLTKNATVYIGYDPRATTLPAWLSGWQKLTDKLGVDDPNISSLVLYSKTYPAGKVTLGGNLASPAAGALNQYCVVAKAQTQAREIVVTFKTGKEAESGRLNGLLFVNQDKIKNASDNFSKTNGNNAFINHSSTPSFRAYPNPFTKNTKIYYTLKNKAKVILSVNSIQGLQMELLVNGIKAAGNYNAIFNASKFASGIYIYKLQIGNEVIAGKLVKE